MIRFCPAYPIYQDRFIKIHSIPVAPIRLSEKRLRKKALQTEIWLFADICRCIISFQSRFHMFPKQEKKWHNERGRNLESALVACLYDVHFHNTLGSEFIMPSVFYDNYSVPLKVFYFITKRYHCCVSKIRNLFTQMIWESLMEFSLSRYAKAQLQSKLKKSL